MPARSAIRKVATIGLVALVTLYVAYLCGLYLLQASLLFPGAATRVAPDIPHADGAELLKITTGQGKVEAVFLPADAGTAPGPKPLVIFAHGNGEVIDEWLSALHGFRERGIGVLLVEYPGYGRSSGTPSETSIHTTMVAAYDGIVADPRVDRTRIFGFGQSLGGGAICLLARDRPLRALILQSTFTSLDGFAMRWWAPSFLLRSRFDNLSVVKHFRGPLLVIHGRNDELVPWQQGRELAAASAHATFKLYACGHGCWDPEHLPFWHDASAFLLEAGILTSSEPPPTQPARIVQ